MKHRLGFAWGLALTGALLSTGVAQATILCDLPLSGLVTTTGACTEVDTQTALSSGNTDSDESATTATSSSTSLAGADSATGMATSTFPKPDGSMGSVGAEGFITGGGGTGEMVAATSSALYIGEFTAHGPGPLVNIGIDLGISGQLLLSDGNDAVDPFFVSAVFLSFTAVDSAGITLDEFAGLATLTSDGNLGSAFDPDPLFFVLLGLGGFTAADFTENDNCSVPTSGGGTHTCTVDMATNKMVNFDVTDGDTFGLFLSLTAFTTLFSSSNLEAHSDFLGDTVTMDFMLQSGTSVTASTPTVGPAVPEPASVGLLLAGLLGAGCARARRGV